MAKNPEHRDLFAGALELMILHSLRVKPMHGYALVKHIKHVSDDLLQVGLWLRMTDEETARLGYLRIGHRCGGHLRESEEPGHGARQQDLLRKRAG